MLSPGIEIKDLITESHNFSLCISIKKYQNDLLGISVVNQILFKREII